MGSSHRYKLAKREAVYTYILRIHLFFTPRPPYRPSYPPIMVTHSIDTVPLANATGVNDPLRMHVEFASFALLITCNFAVPSEIDKCWSHSHWGAGLTMATLAQAHFPARFGWRKETSCWDCTWFLSRWIPHASMQSLLSSLTLLKKHLLETRFRASARAQTNFSS